MIKTELLDYAKQVNEAHDATLAKFQKEVADGKFLHALQWQTSAVAFIIHEKARADVLAVIAKKYEGVELVRELRRLHDNLTHNLITRAGGHHSTNPVSNEIEQMETSAIAHVLEKVDNILRYDKDVPHLTDDAAQKALNVIALDPKIAKWLVKNDPQALLQVNAARIQK